MSNKSGISSQVISLPQGGGALHSLGETFSPDLQTGTGNFSVPINLPPGRNGFQPQLNLFYSTSNGNGPFGLGWNISVPSITRKTSKGVPQYDDSEDNFILSEAEDLVFIGQDQTNPTIYQYRPRTEGLFARINHHLDAANNQNYWEVLSKDGLKSLYGTQTPEEAPLNWKDPGTIVDPRPQRNGRIFSWKLTSTTDPFGNVIEYTYERDSKMENLQNWNQVYLKQINYVDYMDKNNEKTFLVSVRFDYYLQSKGNSNPPTLAIDRPDPFSYYRAGFEIRTRWRCEQIVIESHAEVDNNVRTYQLKYNNDSLNKCSLLSKIQVIGYDSDNSQYMPPLEFSYIEFNPNNRRFLPIAGHDLPPVSLANPNLEMADILGNGLPSILEVGGIVRYWQNLGEGNVARPVLMREAPTGLSLADSGVQLIDANGDGHIDLLVSKENLKGYFSLQVGGLWDKRSFQPYKQAPSFDLKDPEVKLVDLTGDGVTDAIRSGKQLECFFNDPKDGWLTENITFKQRNALEIFPNINFSDLRVKWADMTGDGLQDIVLVYNGSVSYWPNIGRGNWAPQVNMRNCPHFPFGYDPNRILIGDIDGDGVADIVYINDDEVTLWINRSGNEWSEPIIIKGTPAISDTDAVRLVDFLGTGVCGVLWSTDARGFGRVNLHFLDFTGEIKPYLLTKMDNHCGAITIVEYMPSTKFYLEDEKNPKTRWRTSLPFPVQVVSRVEVNDAFSLGKLTTKFRYHHGYWDGTEREFRGFGMVEKVDTESFAVYNTPGINEALMKFNQVESQYFSPPLLTKTWFHLGPIGQELGNWADWAELLIPLNEFWEGDKQVIPKPADTVVLLNTLGQRAKRDAIRALRGSVLRTELYALDGSSLQDRPYTVIEYQYGLREENNPIISTLSEEKPLHIFFPYLYGERTTQWERGTDPLSRFIFTWDYDPYGQPQAQSSVAVPRKKNFLKETGGENGQYLASFTTTIYARSKDQYPYILNRVARKTSFEVKNNGQLKLLDLQEQISNRTAQLELTGQTINYYDSEPFNSSGDIRFELKPDIIGDYGALVRSESLVLTMEKLREIYQSGFNSDQIPPYLDPKIVQDISNINWSNDYPIQYQNLLPAFAGYIFKEEEDSKFYFAITEERRYDFHNSRDRKGQGLVIAKRDGLGHEISIEYDKPYSSLPVKVTDAIKLACTAHYDYRVFQTDLLTDQNGNRTSFSFTPLGLVKNIKVMGKDNEEFGDTSEIPGTCFYYNFNSFTRFSLRAKEQSTLDQGVLSASIKQVFEENNVFLSPEAFVKILKSESLWLIKDLIPIGEGFNWQGGEEINLFYTVSKAGVGEDLIVTGNPISVRTIRRVHHFLDTEVEPGLKDETVEMIEYTDGFGRLLQTRSQAEDELFFDSNSKTSRYFGSIGLDYSFGGANGTAVGIKRAAEDPVNVLVSGWIVYDNKGRVVENYEPFFSQGWEYLFPTMEQQGQKVKMFYDPRGKIIRTLNPDGSESRVIYGSPMINAPLYLGLPDNFEPNPWEVYTYDPNDNAGRTDQSLGSSPIYKSYINTPSNMEIDALGRTIKTIVRNGNDPNKDWFTTTTCYDIQGNVLSIIDELGRKAFSYTYDLANRAWRTYHMDGGLKRIVFDALGKPIEQRDGKGALTLQIYDTLNRPQYLWARNNGSGIITLRQFIEYGDASTSTQSNPDRAENKRNNRLGKVYKQYDGAGQITFEKYDIKGNLLEKVRKVISDDALLSIYRRWETNNREITIPSFQVDWQYLNESVIDKTKPFTTSVTYDALNRVKTIIYPEDVGFNETQPRKKLLTKYNRAGALESVKLNNSIYVQRIVYNARGQRMLIAYGNGKMSRYLYNDQTLRLTRLRTEGYIYSEFINNSLFQIMYKPDGGLLQDFRYEYDFVGNVLGIIDTSPGSGVDKNETYQDEKDPELKELIKRGQALHRRFEYDPLYHLIKATGRECKELGTSTPRKWSDNVGCSFIGPNNLPTVSRENAPNNCSLYREEYTYDPAGNMLTLKHIPYQRNIPIWVRNFGIGGYNPIEWNKEWPNHLYKGDITKEWFRISTDDREIPKVPPGNKLTHVGENDPNILPTHIFDSNGNLIHETTSRNFEWDHSDQLHSFRIQPQNNSEPSIYVQYLYDPSGQRVKKLVRKQGGQYEVTIYIDGLFEYHFKSDEGKSNNTLHVMDNLQRIAIIRVGEAFNDDPSPSIQYHLGDHLGSNNVIIDKNGKWINTEEYFSYGETSLGSFAKKRYRFIGKEHDEESNLYYYGSRYYAPWLARWVSCDSNLTGNNINLYCYVDQNPLVFLDDNGAEKRNFQENLPPRAVTQKQYLQQGRNKYGYPENQKKSQLSTTNQLNTPSRLQSPPADSFTANRTIKLIPGPQNEVPFTPESTLPWGWDPGATIPNFPTPDGSSRTLRGVGSVIDLFGLYQYYFEFLPEMRKEFSQNWHNFWFSKWYSESVRLVRGRTSGDVEGIEGQNGTIEQNGDRPSPYHGKFRFIDELIARASTPQELLALKSSLSEDQYAYKTNNNDFSQGVSILTEDRNQPLSSERFNEITQDIDMKIDLINRTGELSPPTQMGDYPDNSHQGGQLS